MGKWVGEKSPNWKGGLDQRKQKNERNDSKYQAWVKGVKKRDGNRCAFAAVSVNCDGYNIAHHILPWKKYIRHRYKISNGIMLCNFHHPKRREDEIRLIPILQNLVDAKGT